MINRKSSSQLVIFLLFFSLLLFVATAEANAKRQLQIFKSDPLLQEQIKKHELEIAETLENKKADLKENHKKLSTDLLRLINEDFILPGQTREELKNQMKSLRQLRQLTSETRSVDGTMDNDLVYVYIYLYSPNGTHIIDNYSHEVTDRDEENHVAAAWVGIDSLETLTNLDFVRAVRTVMPPISKMGSVTSEGDSIHRADLVRSLGQNGNGIKVGIISNGVDHLTDARNKADLPANVHVLLVV